MCGVIRARAATKVIRNGPVYFRGGGLNVSSSGAAGEEKKDGDRETTEKRGEGRNVERSGVEATELTSLA